MVGTVSDWIRLPQPYSYYTNGESGTQWKSYPNNAPRMAEDAVKAALEKSVQFDASLDTFQKGIITALFIVHSGRGAEKQARQLQGQHIWSHKWNLRNPVQVSNDLWATIYLTVGGRSAQS
ncbi:immune inhibitor A domain-containing protein [Sabulicella rubraurantiaca]|uniref:immune inhibitor A domain-containing protein n=1 Tax=Sabulicella rubraurantiaca TaxID=2811429 RepID=UPI001A96B580|nr:immune inhibitor A domain-containing protein [Sabulicella rubraurantiaca]